MGQVIQSVACYDDIPGTLPLKVVDSEKEIEESYAQYLIDESRLPGGKLDEIIFVHSEKQIVDVLARAHASRIPVTVSAARTGIVGGAVPQGGILLALENLNRFSGVRWDEKQGCWCVRVQPGLSIERLKEILNSQNFQDEYIDCKGHKDSDFQRFEKESALWFYPIDPTEKSAHLGGTVATNASGARSFKYGQTRKFVVSLRVALMDGTIISIRRGDFVDDSGDGFVVESEARTFEIPSPTYSKCKVKNAAGYYSDKPLDFIDLFIGSEGTLGVITEIELALRKKPECILSGVAFFHAEKDAVQFVKEIRSKDSGGTGNAKPSAIEYFDSNSIQLLREKQTEQGSNSSIPPFSDHARAAIYFEQETNEEDLDTFFEIYDTLLSECNTSMDETWGGMEEHELKKMAEFRHAIPEIINTIIGQRQKKFPAIHKVGTDFTVPDENLEEIMEIYQSILESAGLEYVIFGHVGENHLHVNILPRDNGELKKAKEIYMNFAHEAVSMGGSVSGEHGIGKIKGSLIQIMYSKEAIEEMQKIKCALDPEGLLGCGNIFTD